MEIIRLDALPKEMIALVATKSDACSALELSRTCRTVRAACYDSLVFKSILLRSQIQDWQCESLDLDAISSRCGQGDVSSWARYAVSDQRAFEHFRSSSPVKAQEQVMLYLPELLIVKHPVMYCDHWHGYDDDQSSLETKAWFAIATALLTRDDDSASVTSLLRRLQRSRAFERTTTPRDDTVKSLLFALCATMSVIRGGIRERRRIWPYNDQRAPYIPMPSILDVDMTPVSSSYGLPVPYSALNFDRWYNQHIHNQMSSNYMTAGTWHGYYTHNWTSILDPPMKNIQFRVVGQHGVHATDCVDGFDEFRLELSQQGGGASFAGWKRYENLDQDPWYWEMKPTPFGLFGSWGVFNGETQRLEGRGQVWLWKS